MVKRDDWLQAACAAGGKDFGVVGDGFLIEWRRGGTGVWTERGLDAGPFDTHPESVELHGLAGIEVFVEAVPEVCREAGSGDFSGNFGFGPIVVGLSGLVVSSFALVARGGDAPEEG